MRKILYAAGTMEHIRNFHLPYIEKLKSDGHEVTVMAKGAGADIDIPFVKKMFSVRNILCSLKIRRVLNREKFDTVLLNTTLAAFLVRFCMPGRKRPRVINFVHGYMFPKEPKSVRDKIFLLCERLLRKKTDYIMVMNAEDYGIATAHRLCERDVKMTRGMGAKARKSNSLPVELIYEHRRSSKKYIISFVGELCKNKNQQMLICALPEIQIDIPNAVLWLIGDGDRKNELVRLAENLNVSDSVRFWGHKSNPCDYIRASDLYISASLKEGLPFNIIEALGCKKTVIASDVKGQRDIIEDGASGFLFPSGNAEKLVKLVKSVFHGEISINPEKAFERYKYFSFERVFDKTFGIMKELIEG